MYGDFEYQVKKECRKDLLREAEHWRLLKQAGLKTSLNLWPPFENNLPRYIKMKPKTFFKSILFRSIMITLVVLLTGQVVDLQAAGDDDELLMADFGGGFGDGAGSVRVNNLGATVRTMVVQPDHKIVVGGHKNDSFWLARYTPEGTLDKGFGNDGQIITPFSASLDFITALAMHPDGKIVAGGKSNDDFAIAQYQSDGTLEFARTLDFDGDKDVINSIAVQPDGKIVAGGQVTDCGVFSCTEDEFGFARFTITGTPDESFDTDGKVMIGLGGFQEGLKQVVIQADGKIVGIGEKVDSFDGEARVGIIRLDSNGNLDNTFDGDGKFTSDNIGAGIDGVVQPDGKIVAITTHMKMVRFNSTGSIDTSFGNTGIVELITTEGLMNAQEINLQTDGKFLITGKNVAGDTPILIVARYTSQGQPDVSFGQGKGYVTFPSDIQRVGELGIAPDGKIVFLDAGALTRLLPDGELDDGDGRVFTDLTGNNDAINAVAIQPDGNIVVTGHQNVLVDNRPAKRLVVARYSVSGRLDDSFGASGGVIIPNDVFSDGNAIGLDAQGRILVAGIFKRNSTSNSFDFILQRYRSDGAPVFFPGAADRLWPLTDFGGHDSAKDLVVQPDGKIVLAGISLTDSPDFALIRYQESGAPDPTFDNNGRVVTDFDDQDSIESLGGMVLQPDGKIIVVGSTRPAGAARTEVDFALARYRAEDGVLDPTFGEGNGKMTTDVAGDQDTLMAVDLLSNGKIMVGGTATIAGRRQFVVARYADTGQLDRTYNASGGALAGLAVADFGRDAFAHDMILEPDGRVVLVGCVQGTIDRFAIARFSVDGQPDTSFGGDGKATIGMNSAENACAHSVAREARGHYMVAGNSDLQLLNSQFALARIQGREVINIPPTALPNEYTTSLDTPLTIAAPGLLDNDRDAEGRALTAHLGTLPANGTLTLNKDGSFSYVPNPGFIGSDSFTYQADNGIAFSDLATVSIIVNNSSADPNPGPGGDFKIFLPMVVK